MFLDDFTGKARDHSSQLVSLAESSISEAVVELGLESIADDICFIAVGSVGRLEALDQSDLDIIPVLTSKKAYDIYCPLDQSLRRKLQEATGRKISSGSDLTRPTQLSELTNPDSIGGQTDSVSRLTQRVLIATESMQVGGRFPLPEIRAAILQSYADQVRTSGRNVHSFNNDVARYYRTLCVEYKAKVDSEGKDWCTRNVKLRFSRKLWYFSVMLSMCAAEQKVLLVPKADRPNELMKDLIRRLALTPLERIDDVESVANTPAFSRVCEHYSRFLDLMSSAEFRTRLQGVEHHDRYSSEPTNPFPMMKYSSDLLHEGIVSMILECDPTIRRRLIDWFLF